MEWSNSKVLELIDSYQNYPVLWDSKHPKFRDRNSRKKAFIQLALELKCHINDVKSKINKLRGQFQREFLKVKRSSRDESGKDTTYVPKWFAYNAMLSCMGRHDLFSTFKIEESQFDVESIHSEDADQADEERDVESPRYNNSSVEPATHVKKTNRQYDGMLIPENYSAFRSTSHVPERQEDEFSDYGRYIANELRQLKSDPHALACVKYEFNNILFKAAMGQYSKADIGTEEVP